MIYLAAGAMVLFIVCALYIAWANLMSRANVVQFMAEANHDCRRFENRSPRRSLGASRLRCISLDYIWISFLLSQMWI